MTTPLPRTADQRDDEQVREWNTYVATVPIDFYGTRAYNVGDKVPVSAVEGEHAWIDSRWVDRVGEDTTPNPGSQTVPPPEPPTIDQAMTAAPAGSAAAPPPPDTAADATPSADTSQES